LSAGRLRGILSQLQNLYDIVVIDSPPVLGLADTPALSRHCDFILYVARHDFTNTKLGTDAFKRLSTIARVPLVLIGTALPNKAYGYGYGYSYDYGVSEPVAEPQSPGSGWRRRRALRFARLAGALSVMGFLLFAVIDYWNPDRLEQVGGGVMAARSLEQGVEVQSFHGDYRGAVRALDAAASAVERVAGGVREGLPPLRENGRWVLVRFTFTKEDRLGNSVRVPLLSLAFDRQDLSRVNLSKVDGTRLLGLARWSYMWSAGWPNDLADYCRMHGTQPDAAAFCATLRQNSQRRVSSTRPVATR
jgi:hypothetical protein